MKKPTRLKVFGVFILASIIVGFFSILTADTSKVSSERVDLAKKYIEEVQYNSAISILEDINES